MSRSPRIWVSSHQGGGGENGVCPASSPRPCDEHGRYCGHDTRCDVAATDRCGNATGGHHMVTGNDLRAARLSARLSLGQLARMIGRDKGHLSRVETGKGREITPALVRDYERALGVAIAATQSYPQTAAL